jgi:hypothetical protein
MCVAEEEEEEDIRNPIPNDVIYGIRGAGTETTSSARVGFYSKFFATEL